jgi:A/G-specific adenine glycosylase
VLVSEVMLQQTQVARVLTVWDGFMARFPTVDAMAAAPAGAVIAAWGTLGYPRRAQRLWQSARTIAEHGWPPLDELHRLPGVGAYTAAALGVQAFGDTEFVAEVNIARVVARAGHLPDGGALSARDHFLALMDVGALVCTKRSPRCGECPVVATCATRGPLPDEPVTTQPRYEGSFRQRRGRVLAALRAGPARVDDLDSDALRSLVDDGLAVIRRQRARLP